MLSPFLPRSAAWDPGAGAMNLLVWLEGIPEFLGNLVFGTSSSALRGACALAAHQGRV